MNIFSGFKQDSPRLSLNNKRAEWDHVSRGFVSIRLIYISRRAEKELLGIKVACNWSNRWDDDRFRRRFLSNHLE